MLKPTDRPPPSLAPRFAASITPPPPPVTTAQPCSPNSRPVSRAAAYAGCSSPIRAEPNMATAGRSILSTSAKPARNSSAISSTASAGSARSVSRMRRSSTSEVPWDVRVLHPEHEQRRQTEVQERDHDALPGKHAVVLLGFGVAAHLPAAPRLHPADDQDQDQDRIRADDDQHDHRCKSQRDDGWMNGDGDPSPVERQERDEVEQVDEEAEKRQRDKWPRVVVRADCPDGRRSERAEDRACDSVERFVPSALRHAFHLDCRAEKRDEERRADRQSLSLRLEHVAHLVDEEEHDEADPEPPAADPDVDGRRDEHREQELRLEENGAELDEQRADCRERRPDLLQQVANARPGLNRLVVAFGELVLVHDPLPIHSSPPAYTSFFQSGTRSLRVSMASLHAASASCRWGADTAITTLRSPTPTRPIRWWMAIAHSS